MEEKDWRLRAIHYIYFLLAGLLLPTLGSAQVIINEVSQGTGGQMEYVELVVYFNPCEKQCADLRGWIIDDNNGFFAAGSGNGIAPGHMRFSNDPQWTCVNLGALILIYNSGDKNTLIPADDTSDANGDCIYILPDTSFLFEHNPSTPNQGSPPDFLGPYTPGGDWQTTQLSNSNDSYLTADPANATGPFFGVSWGNNTTSNVIYFSGSVTGEVLYMANTNNNDPFDQSNWVRGPAPTEETPGAPNNTANATWLQFINNNCSPFPPLTVTAAPDTAICSGQSVDVSATVNLPVPGSYLWSNGGTMVTTNVSPTDAVFVSVVFTDSVIGCTVEDSVLITVLPSPTADAGQDTTICEGETVNLLASGGNSYQWLNGPATAANGVTPSSTTTFVVTVTDNNNCSDTDSVTVTLNNASPVSISGDTVICSGENVSLSATGTGTLVWSTGDTTSTIDTSLLSSGSFSLTLTDANGCTTTATKGVDVSQLAVTAFPATAEITLGESADFDATTISGIGFIDYSWTPDTALSCNTCPNTTATPEETTSYVVTVMDEAGCEATDTVTVIVNIPIRYAIPTGFTPNNDGFNDRFTMLTNVDIEDFNMQIYNRWGQLIFETNNLTWSWDGTYEEEPQPIGTYVYLIRFRSDASGELKEEVLSGNVSLLR